jgi:molybdate transport system regulatory protein
MRLVYKIWLDNGGKAFGEGPYDLLLRVERTGSLAKACEEMGMSYNKAWRLMREMETRLGFALIERHAGGVSGGGSELTARAMDLMRRWEGLREEASDALTELYSKHFSDSGEE